MRRLRAWAEIAAASLLGLLVLLAILVFLGANTNGGRRALVWLLPRVTAGQVHARGISGNFPFVIRARRLTVSDARGPWLDARDVEVAWQPAKLLRGRIVVDRLAAQEALIKRLPQQKNTKPSHPERHAQPMPLLVRQVAIRHLVFGPALAPTRPSFSVFGSLRSGPSEEQALSVNARAPDGGQYTLEGTRNGKEAALNVYVVEPAHGPLASLAEVPDVGPLHLEARVEGPLDALDGTIDAHLGPLVLRAGGTIDLTNETADLTLSAHAPAMEPRPGLGWRELALQATLHGTLRRPTASALFTLSDGYAAGARLAHAALRVDGSEGTVHLRGELSGVALPGSASSLLAGAPVLLRASADLEAPGRPVHFALRQPLVTARGTLTTKEPIAAKATITLPDLAAFAKLAGIALAGEATLSVTAQRREAGIGVDTEGDLRLSAAPASLRGLLGNATTLSAKALVRGSEIELTKASLAGENASLAIDGGISATRIALAFKGAITDLSRLARGVGGTLTTEGSVRGRGNDLTLDAALGGALRVGKGPKGAIHARLALEHLPKAPSAHLDARGTLGGDPVTLVLAARRVRAGGFAVDIQHASWKSASARGALTLDENGNASGEVSFHVGTLKDLSLFTGTALGGSLSGRLTASPEPATLRLAASAEHLVDGKTSIGRMVLAASLADPWHARRLDARLALAGIQTAGMRDGSATLTAKGTEKALALALNAATPAFGGAHVAASAIVDLVTRTARVSTLAASLRSASVRLRAPTRVTFAHGLAIDGARFDADGAELALAGRVTPELALRVTVRDVTPALLARLGSSVPVKGRLDAEAKLGGTLAAPIGTLRVSTAGLEATAPEMAGLPSASLDLSAHLARQSLRLEATATAGPGAKLALSGTAPLTPSGALALAVHGALDLAVFNPVLEATGRHVDGRLTLAARVTGTPSTPALSGDARLAEGMIADYANGVSLTHVEGAFALQGDTLRIERFGAQAGPGTIALSGSIGLLAPGTPLALRLTSKDAELLQSDRIRVWLDSALDLDGSIANALRASGQIRIRRAEIAIPKRMPASIPTLHVIRPGAPVPEPGKSAGVPPIALAISLLAPRAVFVRGRGVNAEFGGQIQISGTSSAPAVTGGLHLIRGNVSLAGQTLTFTKGTIGFNGGDPSDPTLDIEASTSTASTTATLSLTGTAQHPSIALSSSPELPEDQILAVLLFGGSPGRLSPFQMAEAANALASLSGAGPSVGSPLGTIREGLGLDQLTIGSGPGGAPTLQAGRYVAPGVYVGATQGTNGGGSSANVEIDLSKHLKLDARIGSRATGTAVGTPQDQSTSVGLSYQFEY